MTSDIGKRLDLILAAICAWCPLCRHARRKPDGMANRIVRRVEDRVCPFCRAHTRVAGKVGDEESPCR
jgi:hypothetical protein